MQTHTNPNTDYKTLPEYTGDGVFITAQVSKGTLFIIFLSMQALVFLTRIFSRLTNLNTGISVCIYLFLVIASIVVLFKLVLTPSDNLIVNPEGVGLASNNTNIDKFFKWEDIRTIGISPSPTQKSSGKRYLYISLKEENDDISIEWHTERKDMIIVQYRPEPIHCIIKYRDKEIRNLEAMKSWKKYIDKL